MTIIKAEGTFPYDTFTGYKNIGLLSEDLIHLRNRFNKREYGGYYHYHRYSIEL